MTVSFECSVIYIRVFVRVFLVYLLCAVFFGFPVMCITSVCIYLYIYIDLYIYINLSSSCLWARVFWCLLCMHR